jgi:hypothetical protein
MNTDISEDNKRWMDVIEKYGKNRKINLVDRFPFSCLLFEGGKLIAVGISTDDIDHDITKFKKRYACINILKWMMKEMDKEQQRVNLAEAKKLLSRN